MIAHHFHKQRTWQANVVDQWFAREKNCIVEKEKDENGNQRPGIVSRTHPTDCGGFGAVARNAKSQALRNLMRHMLRNAGWCIATTK